MKRAWGVAFGHRYLHANAKTDSIRVGTFNIRNLADRYEERKPLMQRAIRSFSCDILGLQEVNWNIEDQVEFMNDTMNSYRAPKRFPSDVMKIDGNSVLVSKKFHVRNHELLQLSSSRIAQKLTIEINDKLFWMVNTHLYHIQFTDIFLGENVSSEDIEERRIQAEMICRWCDGFREHSVDGVIITGDFNAHPFEITYYTFLKYGYRSAHELVHKREPLFTFPSGIQAPGMDESWPITTDYIFVQGDLAVIGTSVEANTCDKLDPTLYPSDHLAIVADIEI